MDLVRNECEIIVKRKIVMIGLLSLLIAGCNGNIEEENIDNNIENKEEQNVETVIVNKKNPVDKNYNPGENKEAKAALTDLIKDMQSLDLDINTDYSGYRTYEYQENLYNRYVEREGVEKADTYSARPGYSEHHTGLAFDLKHLDGNLITKENEVNWVRDNAYQYGFIIRYPEGKEDITGYMYEPWHLRYVGDIAKEIVAQNVTLEEFLNVEGGDYINK